MRALLVLSIAIAIFAPFNWLAYRNLTRIHPRRRKLVIAALLAGSLMWPFFPLLRASNDFARATRATLGPLWFGWNAFAVLYSLFLLLLVIAWLPFRRRPFRDFARWPSRMLLWIVIAGFAIGYVQAIVPLRIERVTLRVRDLPSTADGTRLVLLGDLHVGFFTRPSRLEKIFRTAASFEPHAVLIAGDLIDDDPYFVPKLLAGTRALPPSMPLYAVLGNHEMYGDPQSVIEQLRGSRIRLLVNEGVALRDLWIAGVSDPAAARSGNAASLKRDLPRALAGRPVSRAIVLAHQPNLIDEARRLHLPVVLSAHTHGGQLGFRPLRWSLAGVFLRYHMGLYDLPPTQLYINTGTGYWLFPFRLGMTPEITLIELRAR